jgi:hypothetical protein
MVRKLRKAGRSLRWISEETSLGLSTVRTILGKVDGSDRTSKAHRARIEINRPEATSWKRRKRQGDALPRQAQAVVETGHALLKEAKGLGGQRGHCGTSGALSSPASPGQSGCRAPLDVLQSYGFGKTGRRSA